MEPITKTTAEFLEEIARPRGMTLDDTERQWKDAMRCGTDWKISVGARNDLYVVALDSIKAYFEAKNAPKPAPPAPDSERMEAFMIDTAPAKPEKEKGKGASQK